LPLVTQDYPASSGQARFVPSDFFLAPVSLFSSNLAHMYSFLSLCFPLGFCPLSDFSLESSPPPYSFLESSDFFSFRLFFSSFDLFSYPVSPCSASDTPLFFSHYPFFECSHSFFAKLIYSPLIPFSPASPCIEGSSFSFSHFQPFSAYAVSLFSVEEIIPRVFLWRFPPSTRVIRAFAPKTIKDVLPPFSGCLFDPLNQCSGLLN